MKLLPSLVIISLFCPILPTSSTSLLLRRLRRRLHNRNSHPWADGLFVNAKPEERETFSVIVWGATLGTRNDTKHHEGLFCIARYGSAKSSWDEKLRGTGRVSNTSKPMTTSPTWNLGMLVTGTEKTEISVRVFAIDEPELSLPELRIRGQKLPGKRRLVGEFSVGVGTLHQASGNSVDGKASFKLPGGGHLQLTAARGGAVPNFALAAYGLSPSVSYETADPIPAQQAVRIEDITGIGPMIVGTAPLPIALQGIWWVSGQSSGPSLLSFGGPNNDGNGCSLGYISGDRNSYKIRSEGDGVVATSEPSGLDKLMEAGDKTYYFEFDDAADPTFGQVYTLFEGFGIGKEEMFPEQVVNSQMHLLPEGDVEYPGSLVWLRNTTIWNLEVLGDTKMVQVVDGAGEKIEPAWSKFVAAEKDPDMRQYPGWIFYKSVKTVSSPWAVAVTEELLQRVQLHMLLIIVGMFVLASCCCGTCAYCAFRMHRTVRQTLTGRYERRLTLKQNYYWIH